MMQHGAAFLLVAATAAGGKLNDHPGAVLDHALLDSMVLFRIRRRGLVIIAYVDVNQRRAGLKGFMGRLNLLTGRHRHSWCDLLGGQRTGDGNSDDTGLNHDVPSVGWEGVGVGF